MLNSDEMFKEILGIVHGGKNKKMLLKLTPEENSRFIELEARFDAMITEKQRVISKLRCDSNRLWADLKDKYKIHGKNLEYDEKEMALFETIEK